MPIQTAPKVNAERRDRFRRYMRSLNPTAPSRDVIESGLAVPTIHGSVHQSMAARADLEPGSQQILVGGIGSGKTTELLLAQRWFIEQGHTICLYIDVSVETDLSALRAGTLLAALGLHVVTALQHGDRAFSVSAEQKAALEQARHQLNEFAHGKSMAEWVPAELIDHEPPADGDDFGDDEPGYLRTWTVPGKLKPPLPRLQFDVKEIRIPLEQFVTALRAGGVELIAILDGLDRLIDPEKFATAVYQDFRIFRQLGIAVLAAAPLSVLYGRGRVVAEQFDRVHHIPALQTSPGQVGTLKSILMQRGARELMTPGNIEKVCQRSGGVLRDLITIARDAGELAYLEGCDSIRSQHIMSAGRQLGESYLRGLNAEKRRQLSSLLHRNDFDITSPIGIEMLVTRRVLEYSATDVRVHPALAPLLSSGKNDG